MTTIEIIIAIISSSVLSAIFTSTVNWKLHNANYKKDYYKKLLDRRLTSYETVQTLAGKLSFSTHFENSITPVICSNEEFYQGFIVLLASAIDSSFWLGKNTSSKLTELNVYLVNNITNNVDESLPEELKAKSYQELGSIHFDKIREFRKQLQSLVKEELKNLHKINSFLNENSKDSERIFEVYKSKFNQ